MNYLVVLLFLPAVIGGLLVHHVYRNLEPIKVKS